MNKEVLHIEICKSFYKDGTFNLKIGDIAGSTETSNCSKEDVLKDISDEIDDLKKEIK